VSANLDFVRSIYADWECGDFSRSDWADPQIEYVIVGGPEPGESTGLAGMAKAWRNVLRTMDDYRSLLDECREIDAERVLVLVHRSGHGKTSGLDVAQVGDRGAALFHIRNGRVTRLVIYLERDQALADLDLEG